MFVLKIGAVLAEISGAGTIQKVPVMTGSSSLNRDCRDIFTLTVGSSYIEVDGTTR